MKNIQIKRKAAIKDITKTRSPRARLSKMLEAVKDSQLKRRYAVNPRPHTILTNQFKTFINIVYYNIFFKKVTTFVFLLIIIAYCLIPQVLFPLFQQNLSPNIRIKADGLVFAILELHYA